MEYKFLKTSISEDGISIMTISSPSTLNALDMSILLEIESYIDSLGSSSAKVLIITGEGKSFVAGANISQMSHFGEKQGLEFAELGSKVFKKIEDLPIPVIAAINGFALGGGCELALACDIRIASEKASFGQPEVKLGIIPGFNGTYRLSKIVGQGAAKKLIYLGERISSSEALRIGLVNDVTAQDVLMDTVLAMAKTIIANAPIAVRYAKQSINENYDLTRDEAITLENKLFSKCFITNDQKEGMSAFLEKRKANFINE